jgi:hypothetical protein
LKSARFAEDSAEKDGAIAVAAREILAECLAREGSLLTESQFHRLEGAFEWVEHQAENFQGDDTQ